MVIFCWMLVGAERSIAIHSSQHIAKRIDGRDRFSQRNGLLPSDVAVYGGWQEPATKKTTKATNKRNKLAMFVRAIEWVMILLAHPHTYTSTGRFLYILRVLLSKLCGHYRACVTVLRLSVRCNVLILNFIVHDQPKQRAHSAHSLQLSANPSCSFHGHPVLKLNAICICIPSDTPTIFRCRFEVSANWT